MNNSGRTGVLFVCMGNICRSPVAEAVFLHLINRDGVADQFHVDSAGTGGWHAGEPADARMRAAAEAEGIVITSRARQVTRDDLDAFEHIICMDHDNRAGVLQLGGTDAQVRLLLSHAPDAGAMEVPDPYYGGADGFRHVIDLVQQGCAGLLSDLLDPTTHQQHG